MDPAGDGGGGPTSIASTDDNGTPVTPSTGIAGSPGSHHQQHPPPSPLSGCYLLVVLPEPHTAQHRDLILNRLAKGFLSWDKDSCHVDLEKELQALVAQAPEGEEARNGERLIQYATENLVTEVLIHPQTNTLLQCIRNLLASFTKHRHIIHAGYTFSGNGSWILQDGTFSLADFLDAISEHEVQRVLRAYENSVTVDINCAGVGEWSTTRLLKEACTRFCRVRLNPDDVLTAGVPAISSFTNYVGQYLVSQTLDQLMEPSDVVGNIRFSHPTLYVFPGGQGDAALFGINGFNMLVDGGFARKACFWDFARHLDRLDAVLITRINNSNVGGMSSVLRKKREMHVYPQIGHFFCNLIERRLSNSPDGDKDLDPLILSLTDIGQDMMVDLRHINLRTHPCYRDPNPINLYHKVGHGTLDMYVLSPSKDSREVKEFLTKWHASDAKLFAGSYRKDSNNLTFPIQNLASICALLVWQPANPEDTITRILFPGSTPQHKIFEGIERLKHLEFLKHPVCTAKSLSPSNSLMALKDKPIIKQKLGLLEESKKSPDRKKDKRDLSESKLSKYTEDLGSKPASQPVPPIQTSKIQPSKIDVKMKKVLENKKIEKDLKEMKKESIKKDSPKMEKDTEIRKLDGYKIRMDNEKTAIIKESKYKSEPKKKETKEARPIKIIKAEPVSKTFPKLSDKKQKLQADKKDQMKASPLTPKKIINGTASKVELSKTTPRSVSKPASKQHSTSMPAKSAKDANNRKVVEQKNIEIASAASADTSAVVKLPAKQKTAERKPIGRRPKPVSPVKARAPISPSKSTRSTPTVSVKSDKDGVIRKVKSDRGTTDSSTVSTPSGIEIDSMTKQAEKCLTEKSEDMSLDSIESKVLADLKEEREVVEEIEAVLQKAERIEGARRDDHLDGDDDVTAEATDRKEDDMTEDDVTADIEELPKKESSRKTSHEMTEEDEYLIIEKEEIYIEDSVQSGEGEHKHLLDAVESETAKTIKDLVTEEDEKYEEEEHVDVSEEKEKADVPEKQLVLDRKIVQDTELDEISSGQKEVLEEDLKDIIPSATETVQKAEEKDDSGKKDSEDMTKEPSSLSPDKFDSSEKKTTDTDVKPEIDEKDQQVPEKLEESHGKMSTLESGATTTAPTLPEDERIPLDDIKEVIDEKNVVDQEKEKECATELKEASAAPVTESKPDTKPFEVRPPLRGIQREIVKTPDEVADLPVHEEVDPKLYRMEDFEKVKEEKPSQMTAQQQESKEAETPQAKEQKGVFSFFGKVADKFEKSIDKLTGKSRRDSEKDIDEKSSSKSGSPKEIKAHDIIFPSDVEDPKMIPTFSTVGEVSELPEAFEKGQPEGSKIKVATIKDTASFLKEEAEDLQKTTHVNEDWRKSRDKQRFGTEAGDILKPVFETCVLKDNTHELSRTMIELDIEEDAEDVEALLEEASKKFKTVKDSLHDSLESLEEKIAEEDLACIETVTASKDTVKDTLSEVVEKLEDIKPPYEDELSGTKDEEKIKYDSAEPDHIEIEKSEDLATVTKDFREAVRDVGEVLAGSAGILIEDKPKDVVEIVKKVAEVLKKDDFLSHDVLFDKDAPKEKSEVSDGESKIKELSIKEMEILQYVGVTEELSAHEKIEEVLGERPTTTLIDSKPEGDLQILEIPAVETTRADDINITSLVRDSERDTIEAMKIGANLIEDGDLSRKQKICGSDSSLKPDVMEAGIEAICVKKKQTHPSDDRDPLIEEPNILFDRKISPVIAEVVIVTPDLSPTSPKLNLVKTPVTEVETAHELCESLQISPDVQNALRNNASLDIIIEDLVFTKKLKITMEIIEYIMLIRKLPREHVIHIIDEVIIRKGLSPNNVIADLKIMSLDSVSPNKREEIERYIEEKYLMENTQITMQIIQEISTMKFINRRIIIEIIEEILIRKKIPHETVLDISKDEYLQLNLHESETMIECRSGLETSEIIVPDDLQRTVPVIRTHSEIKEYVIDELIAKNIKITPQIIDNICVPNKIPRRTCIEIIEELITERNITQSSMFNITEKDLSELLTSEKEHVDDDEVTSKSDKKVVEHELFRADSQALEMVITEKSEIENTIVAEYVLQKKRITPYIFEDICIRYKVPRRVVIEIIEKIIVKQQVERNSILDITDTELSELLSVVEAENEEDELRASSIAKRNLIGGVVRDDKLVDGFVNISSKDNILTENIARRESVDPALEESEKYIIDDFEAVEQECKIDSALVTSDKETVSKVQTAKTDAKLRDDLEEVIEDDVSDVVEAKEKKTSPPMEPLKITKKESEKVSDIPEIIYNTEKDSFVTQESTSKVQSPDSVQSSEILSVEQQELEFISDIDPSEISDKTQLSIQKVKSSIDSVIPHDDSEYKEKDLKLLINKVLESDVNFDETKVMPMKVTEEINKNISPKVGTEITVEVRKLSKDEFDEEHPDSEKQESNDKSPISADENDTSKTKCSTENMTKQQIDVLTKSVAVSRTEPAEDDKSLQDSSVNDEITMPSSAVRRMVITASSEDGGHETVVCSTGNIIVTPDDSLRSSPIKITPDQDSINFDQEPCSGASTPKKYCLSDKSTPGIKDGDKITLENSLDKSTSITRDSQDLEDSLGKPDLSKVKTIQTDTISSITADEKSIAILQPSVLSDVVELKTPVSTVEYDVSLVQSEVKKSPTTDLEFTSSSIDLHHATESAETLSHKKESLREISSEAGLSKFSLERSPEDKQTSDVTGSQSTPEGDKKELADAPPTAVVINDEADTTLGILVLDEKLTQKLDLERSPSKLKANIISEKLPHDDMESITSDTAKSTKTVEEIVSSPSESSGMYSHEMIETSQRLTKQEVIEIDKSEHSGSNEMNDMNKSISEKRSPSPTVGDYPEDIHDQLKHSGVIDDAIPFNDTVGISTSVTHGDKICDSTSLQEIGDAREAHLKSLKSTSTRNYSKQLEDAGSAEKTQVEGVLTLTGEQIVSKPTTDDSMPTGGIIADSITPVDTVTPMDLDLQPIQSLKVDDKGVDKSPSDSILSDKHSVVDDHRGQIITTPTGKCKSASLIDEYEDKQLSSDRSSPINIIQRTPDEKKLAAECIQLTTFIDKHDEIVTLETAKKTTTPDKSEEFHAEHKAESRSKSPVISKDEHVDDKAITSADSMSDSSVLSQTSVEKSRSPSPAKEHIDDHTTIDCSRSSSIIDTEHMELDHKEPSPSKSLSIAGKFENEKQSPDRSGSFSSIMDNESCPHHDVAKPTSPAAISTKDSSQGLEIPHTAHVIEGLECGSEDTGELGKKDALRRSMSPSIASDDHSEIDDTRYGKSRSPSITEVDKDKKPSVDHPVSLGISDEMQSKSDFKSVDTSKSPSVLSDKSDRVPVDDLRSPSVTDSPCHEKEIMHHDNELGSPSASDMIISKSEPTDELSFLTGDQDNENIPSLKATELLSIGADEQDTTKLIEDLASGGISIETQDKKDSTNSSRSSSISAENQKKIKELVDPSRSPGVTIETGGELKPFDNSRSPSIVAGEHDEEEDNEIFGSTNIVAGKPDDKPSDRFRSPSIFAEQQDEKPSIDRSRSSSIVAEQQDEKSLTDSSRLSSSIVERFDEQPSIDRSRSSSIVLKEQNEKPSIDRSRSSSIDVKEQHDRPSIDRSRSSSIFAEEQDEKPLTERSRSSSIITGRLNEKSLADRSSSSSIMAKKQDENPSFDRPRASSIDVEEQGEKTSMGHSQSFNIVAGKLDDKPLTDRSRSSSIIAEKEDKKTLTDQSRVPSVVSEKQEEKSSMDRLRSPSMIADEQDEKPSMDRSGSSSEVVTNQDEESSIDRSRSSSIVAGKLYDEPITDRSRSSSIIAEKEDEKLSMDRSPSAVTVADEFNDKSVIDRSISSSISTEKEDETSATDKLRSPSIVCEKRDEKPLMDQLRSPSTIADEQDEKPSIDRSRSSSDVAAKKNEGSSMDRSRSSSIVAGKLDDEPLSDRSRSSSIITEKEDEKSSIDRMTLSSIILEKQDEESSMDRSPSAVIVADELNEKPVIDRSRSSSFSAEKEDEKSATDKSRSPSIVSEKQDEKPLMDRLRSSTMIADEQDEQPLMDRSGSSSDIAAKQDEESPMDRSRSSSIVAGKLDDRPLTDRSRSSSIIGKKADEKISIDRMRLSSIVLEKQDEKSSMDRAPLAVIVADKLNDKPVINRSRSSSISVEKEDEKPLRDQLGSSGEVSAKQDEEYSVDRSRSSSIVAGKLDDKPLSDRSRSSCIFAEKANEKSSIDRIRLSSIVVENQDEKPSVDRSPPAVIGSYKLNDEPVIDRSRSSSISAEKEDEKSLTHQSRSPSIVSEKKDEKPLIDRLQSPSMIADEQDEKPLIDQSGSSSEVAAKQDEESSMDRSRSSSIVAGKLDDAPLTDRSRSSSIIAKKEDEQLSIDRTRLSSIVLEKQHEKSSIDRSPSAVIVADKLNDKAVIDRSRSSSISPGKEDEKLLTDQTRSPSIVSEKQDEERLMDRLRSASMIADEQNEKPSIDRSGSSSEVVAKQDEESSTDRSRPSTIVDGKLDDKPPSDRSGSSSIIAEKVDETSSIDRTRLSSIVIKNQDEKPSMDRSPSASIGADELNNKPVIDRSRSSSISAEKEDENTSTAQSRSPSNVSEKQDEKPLKDRLRSPSFIADDHDEKLSIDQSGSSSEVAVKQGEKSPLDRSRSSSIVVGKLDDKPLTDRSRSSSIIAEKEDEKSSIDRRRLSGTVVENQNEKLSMDGSPSAVIVADELKDKSVIDRSRSSNITAGKEDEKSATDKSRLPSVVSEKQDEKPLKDRLPSPSMIADEQDEIPSVDRSGLSSEVAAKQDKKSSMDRSRSSSIVAEKEDDNSSIDQSRSSSIVVERLDNKLLPGRSRSSSISAERVDEKPLVDRSISSSIVGEKFDEVSTDRSRSFSISAEKQDENTSRLPHISSAEQEKGKSLDDSKPMSCSAEKLDAVKSPDHSGLSVESDHTQYSRPSSIATKKLDEEKSIECLKSSSITTEAHDRTQLTDHSRSSITAGDKQGVTEPIDYSTIGSNQQIKPEPYEHSRSSSNTAGEQDEKELLENTGLSGIPTGKQNEEPLLDHSKTCTVVIERQNGQEQLDRSRSSSIAADEQLERKPIYHSRSPSITHEKPDVGESIDQNRSSITTTPCVSTGIQDYKEPVDRFRSISIAVGDQDEKQSIHHSRLASIALEEYDREESIITKTHDKIKSTDHSGPPDIICGKQHGTEPIDYSTIAAEKQAKSEPIDCWKSSNIPAGRQKDMLPLDQSTSSRIIAEKQDEKPLFELSRSPSIVAETRDDQLLTNRSRSSSIAASDYEKNQPSDGSRSSSIVAEALDTAEPLDCSESAVFLAKTHCEKDQTVRSKFSGEADGQDEKLMSESSLSSNIATELSKYSIDDFNMDADKLVERQHIDSITSSSIDAEKPDESKLIARSRSSSIGTENLDAVESLDHSRLRRTETHEGVEQTDCVESPIMDAVIDGIELDDHCIIATKNERNEELIDLFSSSIIATDEKEPIDCPTSVRTGVEMQNIDKPNDRIKSASITIEPYTEKKRGQHSTSCSTTPVKQDENELADCSKSSSIHSDGHEEKKSIDDSGSSSNDVNNLDRGIDADCLTSSMVGLKSSDRSSSSSILTEIHEKKDSTDRLRSSSIVAEQLDEEPMSGSTLISSVAEMHGEKEQGERSRSSSIASEKLAEIEPFTKSAIASKKPDTTEPKDRSRISSIVSELDGKVSELDDSGSPSIYAKKSEESEPIDLSKASVIIDEGSSNGDKSQSPSTVHAQQIDETLTYIRKDSISSATMVEDSDLDKKDTVEALRTLAETLADASAEMKCDRNLLANEADQQMTDTFIDRSRSHSLFDADKRTPMNRSRTASLYEDKVPEVLSLLDEVKTGLPGPAATNIYEESVQATITKNDVSKKSSTQEVADKKIDLSSNSKLTKLEDVPSEALVLPIEEYIVEQFGGQHHTSAEEIAKVKEYIINRYIINEEKITLRIVKDIGMLYSMPTNVVFKLIEAIIIDNNMSRNAVIDFLEDEEAGIRAVMSEDRNVDIISIPLSKRNDIETYLQGEFISKNKKISSTTINEIAATKSTSRRIIIMIINQMIVDRNLSKAGLIEGGVLSSQSTPENDLNYSEPESIARERLTIDDRLIQKDNFASISTDIESQLNLPNKKEPHVSEQQRVEIETYVMEECVKKGRKITVLVFEQIMTTMNVSRSVLLNIIENIIVTRKMSRRGMVDDAIYDEVDTEMCKPSVYQFSEAIEKAASELVQTKEQLVELSGNSTPDPKSSGYSTPEARQYDDKFGKEMSSYSTDYESPFHKAFVGGMSEIRTTHITTLSGKSTPDYSVRGDTPEAVFDSMGKSNEAKFEGEFPATKAMTSEMCNKESSKTLQQIPSMLMTHITTSTTAATNLGSPTRHIEVILDDTSGTMKIPSHEIYEKENPVLMRKIVDQDLLREEDPIIIRKVMGKEIIDEQPETITTIIRRTIIDTSDETVNDGTISKSFQLGSPETMEQLTVRTSKVVLPTEIEHYDHLKIQAVPEKIILGSEYMDGTEEFFSEEPLNEGGKRIITTVTTITVPEHEPDTTTLSDAVMSKTCTRTEVVGTVEETKPSESSNIKGKVTETTKPPPLTYGNLPDSDSSLRIRDSALADDDCKFESITHSEKINKKQEHPTPFITKNLKSDRQNYLGETSSDIALPRDSQPGNLIEKSTPDLPISSLIRDGTSGYHQISGRSTPDKRPVSRTATPEGLRSNEVIRTTITTTRTMSEEGDIITTTMEITETTNEKGETTILAEKTDVKVEDRILATDVGKSSFCSGFEAIKGSIDLSSTMDTEPISPRSDHSSLHSRAGTQVWESSEERHTYSDEEVPGSPLSTTSQVGYSPQSTYHFGEHSFGKGSSHKSMEFSEADMSSSFYGELPELPPRVTTMKTAYIESSCAETSGTIAPSDVDFSFKKFTIEKEPTGKSSREQTSCTRYSDDGDLDCEKASMERNGIKNDKELPATAESCPPSGSLSSTSLIDTSKESVDIKKDPLADWDPPLGLPSPKPPRKFNLRTIAKCNNSDDTSSELINFDVINDWGEPLRLPSPAGVSNEASNKGTPSTPKRERKQQKKIVSENIKNRKLSESPTKTEKKSKDSKSKIQPVYMDLTYVPHHGNSYYTSIEFFKRVRARYYVFSGTEPSREVYDALLDAKKTWEDKDLEVTMIPTYDTDTLGYWVADNEEALAANHIDLSPSASRCTINLQDHETSCSAYRLEF